MLYESRRLDVMNSKEGVCVDPGESHIGSRGPGLPGGEKAGSWLQTAEEKRHSKMAKEAGDGLATSSRDSYAQSECIVYCTIVIQYNYNRNRVSLYYLFQENKSFGTSCHLHSSSHVREGSCVEHTRAE
jgi:hypothetical protein